jgi:hypothetical protein
VDGPAKRIIGQAQAEISILVSLNLGQIHVSFLENETIHLNFLDVRHQIYDLPSRFLSVDSFLCLFWLYDII